MAGAMRQFIHKLIDERLVIAIILLNAVALFLGDFQAKTAPDSFWFAIDFACVAYFVCETGLKLWLNGQTYFHHNWNRFDFIVVVMSTPVLLTPWIDMYWISSLTALRLLRLFRLFRLFRFIPGRDQMAAGIVRSLRASVGVMLGVLLVNIILALGAVVLFGGSPDDPYFGTPWRAVYAMFQVFTVEGWYEIPSHVARETDSAFWGAFARVYFSLAVFAGGILGLSLVNAVFVDQMTADNNNPLERRIEHLAQEVTALRNEIRGLRTDLGANPNAPGSDHDELT
jgi:voltage-gated sodium channel